MKKKMLPYFILLNGTIFALQKPYQAIVITPVADLAGQSLGEQNKNAVTSIYKNLAICGKKGEFACPRIHQALFHEYVTILEEHGDEVVVKINNFFFEKTDKDNAKHNIFWSLKKNFIPVDHLKKHAINFAHIPEPIDYQKKQPLKQNIITLLAPYKDPTTGQLFSAGTRFVSMQKTIDHYTWAYALDPKKPRMHKFELPKAITTCTDKLNQKQKMQLFVKLCQQWANAKTGFIPYVWGGCSVVNLCKSESFNAHEAKDHLGKPITFFKRNDTHHPYGGLDCAGLVARAAQTAGLPYYYKNTTTLAKHLSEHTKATKLQPGDLIWFSGHVMIIGNVEKNTVIEARHYSHGYGKVHEIPISKVFKGINTFDNLKQAYLNHKPLIRMDKEQRVTQTINQFKLLQMNSIF